MTWRAEYREFIRRNHPDRGGDPEAFAAGLAELRARRDARFDAPVVGGADPPRGVRGAARRVRRWYTRRFRKPRVR
ncbi:MULTISPECIES: hypothetical protein [Actinokineospora]|uniref:J domain-containing protein n=1 Tax=Actinokineospora fastidiosa TaxID=1816 RepID=A0A918LI05_9PSEU|nr:MULTISPECIES: hypothetical protein [Actinokineospora]UVS78024.1 hypothetical protein Actkin_01748 [Actinokineospora sp. UTMC 2448]GGS50275.1 hypothetical protein GCM10010171_51800 [Actinokineospora fastidiosa]